MTSPPHHDASAVGATDESVSNTAWDGSLAVLVCEAIPPHPAPGPVRVQHSYAAQHQAVAQQEQHLTQDISTWGKMPGQHHLMAPDPGQQPSTAQPQAAGLVSAQGGQVLAGQGRTCTAAGT